MAVPRMMSNVGIPNAQDKPKWALSDEWKDELRRREEEMVQAVEEAER